MVNDKTIQEIESTLNILLCKMTEREYIDFIKNNVKVSEYDFIMKNYDENSISEDLLNEVKKITENKLKEFI